LVNEIHLYSKGKTIALNVVGRGISYVLLILLIGAGVLILIATVL